LSLVFGIVILEWIHGYPPLSFYMHPTIISNILLIP
jgi:hypothetical protein